MMLDKRLITGIHAFIMIDARWPFADRSCYEVKSGGASPIVQAARRRVHRPCRRVHWAQIVAFLSQVGNLSMAIRISEYVLAGELRNTTRNSVAGWIEFAPDWGVWIELMATWSNRSVSRYPTLRSSCLGKTV